MANTESKIDRLGLKPEILSWYLQGTARTGKAIAAKLQEAGHDISPATVCRYLSTIKHEIEAASRDVIRDHVNEKLPEDLDALERLEAQCLTWANEDPKDLAERVATAAAEINGELDAWMAEIKEAAVDAKRRATVIRFIIKRCLGYITRDSRFQDKRLAAMKQAVSIIEIKIKNASGLDDEKIGRIVVMDRQSEGPVHRVDPAGGKEQGGRAVVRLTMAGGGDGA